MHCRKAAGYPDSVATRSEPVIEFKYRCKSVRTMLMENPLNASPLSFPILECFHIVGLAISVGPIAIVDFRLLGWGMRRESPAGLAKDTFFWTLGGLILMIFSGLLLFSSDPDNYYLNYAFDLKMFFLVSAIIFNYTIHRKIVSEMTTGLLDCGRAKLVACVSLALWALVIFGGIFIGFLNSTLDINHI